MENDVNLENNAIVNLITYDFIKKEFILNTYKINDTISNNNLTCEKEKIYKTGVFWVNNAFIKDNTNNDTNVITIIYQKMISTTYLNKLSNIEEVESLIINNTYNHKILYSFYLKHLSSNNDIRRYINKSLPFNFNPRGRINLFSKDKFKIFLNPILNNELTVNLIKHCFDLDNDKDEVVVINDGSKHYKAVNILNYLKIDKYGK